MQNGVFYPIDNKPAYSEKHISVIAPLAKLAQGNSVVYHFGNSLWYRYGEKSITNLTVDFGNGTFAIAIQNGTIVQNDFSVNYSVTNENKKLTFNIVYNDGSTLTTYATIGISAPPASYSARGFSGLEEFTSTIPDPGSGALGKIEYRKYYGSNNSDNKLRKPFIIVDGFDPGDKRRISASDCQEDSKCLDINPGFDPKNYSSIESLMKYGSNDLKEKLLNLNYDVIIVNFPTYQNNLREEIDGGADDIFRNGRTIASFIQKVNIELQSNGSAEKLVVVGPSMGGQITRYALAYLEKNNIPTNTRLWLSMDSPHQGATIPLAIQGDLYWMGDILGKEDAKTKYQGILQSKAAKQMLLTIAGAGNNFYNYEHDAYMKELKSNGVFGSNGYPKLDGIKKIAITNGSITGMKNVSPGEKFYEVAAFAKVRFLGVKVDNKPVFRINNWFMPEKKNTSTLIQNYSYEPKNTTNWNLTNNLFQGSLDAVPGGNFNSADDTKHAVYDELKKTNAFTFPLSGSWYLVPILWTGEHLKVEQRLPNNIDTLIIPQSFIPTHSALDTSGFSDWYQPINTNLVCSGQTPFDSYYGEATNMEHITFTDNMVNWLVEWLNGNNPPAASGSNSSEGIEGPSLICQNQTATYSFNSCAISGTPQWSVSGTAVIISQTSNSITLNGSGNGKATISAIFPNGQNLTKTIWVGKPLIYTYPDPDNTNYATFYVESAVSGVSLEDMGLTPNSVVWKKVGTTYSTTGYSYTGRGAGYNWSFDVDIEATNTCGTTILPTTITPPPPPLCDTYKVANITTNQYTIARIIDPICPNSTQYKSLLSSKEPNAETYKITVANSLGNIIIRKTGKDFDLANFPTGTYYVKVEKENKILISQTLLKNN